MTAVSRLQKGENKMKPIIAIACMVLGSASMATMVYLTSHPKALLSHSPPIHGYVEVPVQVPNPSRTEESEVPRTIQVAPIHIKVRHAHAPTIQPANVNITPSSEEPTLAACSDWRPLGPSSIESGEGSGEHQVKLLCPTGANAQDTFMADVQLHPTKMRLNDWSQMRQE
jgi:hypothetical protein